MGDLCGAIVWRAAHFRKGGNLVAARSLDGELRRLSLFQRRPWSLLDRRSVRSQHTSVPPSTPHRFHRVRRREAANPQAHCADAILAHVRDRTLYHDGFRLVLQGASAASRGPIKRLALSGYRARLCRILDKPRARPRKQLLDVGSRNLFSFRIQHRERRRSVCEQVE